MLSPKRTKFRKHHRGRLKGKACRGNKIMFGDYGMQALEPTWLTSRQIEATRRSITRSIRRAGKLWIRVFPDKPITERAAETRMGSGKGAVEFWVAAVKPGHILFELGGLPADLAVSALKTAAYKLPIKVKIAKNERN